jgi:hypothetical protein
MYGFEIIVAYFVYASGMNDETKVVLCSFKGSSPLELSLV